MARGFCFRHFRTDTVSISASGNIVNLQGVPEAAPDQRMRPGNLPESDTLVQNRPCEAGRSMLQERDDVPGCRTTMLQDQDPPKDESNYNLAAHKEWALGFKESIVINKNVEKVAVFGKDSPKFNAEKEIMEDDKHRWVTDYDETIGWLRTSNS